MAKKQEKIFDEDVDNLTIDDSADIDDDDLDSLEDENIDEVEEIEAKLQNGEEITPSASDVSLLLKAQVIYSCPRCHKIYFKNKWIKDTVTDIYTVRTELAYCNKCIGKDLDNFVGIIEIFDKDLVGKKEDLMNLAKQVENQLEDRQSFEYIIDMVEKNDIFYLFANTTRLAVQIAREIRHQWRGSIQYEWYERNQFLRAKWFAEVQNRDYFKKRIRASKEIGFGLFTFENEF